jgi:hypothetical protein
MVPAEERRVANADQPASPSKIGRVALPLAQPPVQDSIQVSATPPSANTGRLFDAPRGLALWHLASLDAPTVAVVWSLAFAWAGRVHLAGGVVLVLALATWCAYVSDRLLDARVLGPRLSGGRVAGARAGADRSMWPKLRERHYFHWRNRRLFVPLAVVAACVAGVVALNLPILFVRERGSILAAAALAYFSGVHVASGLEQWRRSLQRLVSKEFLVAVIFTAGCILPAWSRLRASGAQEFLLWWFWIPGIYFAAIVWLNCSSIARWESDGSRGEERFDQIKPRLFEPRVGEWTNLFAALLVAFAGLLLAVAASKTHPRSAALIFAGLVSALLLALLDRMRTRMTPLALRAAADLVLLTPLLLFLR